jgi:hypothetical protein
VDAEGGQVADAEGGEMEDVATRMRMLTLLEITGTIVIEGLITMVHRVNININIHLNITTMLLLLLQGKTRRSGLRDGSNKSRRTQCQMRLRRLYLWKIHPDLSS